jgi:hypothetical protein
MCCSLLAGCGSDSNGPSSPKRSYLMGFSAIPPRVDTTLLLPTLELAAQHSDVGLIQLSIPWSVLLDDTAAATEVRVVRLPLADYYRATGRPIIVALDITDGLNRAAEDPQLVAVGRSIADTAIQRLYREYVAAIDSILQPEWISLAAETNLVRALAPDSVYQAVVTMTNAAAAERVAAGSTTPLIVSVQVEYAWGMLGGENGVFRGIAQDRADFPFIEGLGLSSYPYLGNFTDPDQLPIDYYERITRGAPLPMLVLEGGWTSASTDDFISSPETQARYIARHGQILDLVKAKAWLQITFTDLDIANIPLPPGSILPLFASNGLVTTELQPKPALSAWDSIFSRGRM